MNGNSSRKRKSTVSPPKMGVKLSKILGWGTKTEEAAPSSSKEVEDVAVEDHRTPRIAAGGDKDTSSRVDDGVEVKESDDGPPALDRQDEQPSEELPLDKTQDLSPEPSPAKTVEKKKEAEEAKDAQKKEEDDIKVDKVVEKTPPPLRSSSRGKKSIADFGYHFKDGKLRTIEGDEGFKFTNQREYEQLGDLIGDYVYELLEAEGLTKRYFDVGRNRRFYFASRNYEQKERILVLIHGSGVVKAGQWARRLIINESLERGTQLPYIKKGLALGWGVVVINYNETCVGQSKGCHGPDAHGTTEMRFALRPAPDAEVVVVAHSAGGGVISTAIKEMHRKDDYRVLCVALTDSWFSEGKEVFAVNFHTTKKQLSRRAGVFQMFSGDETHEGSSSACINACFSLLEGVTDDTTDDDFLDLLEDAEQIITEEYKEKQRAKRRQAGDTASVKSLELEKAKEDEKVVKKDKKKKEEEEEEAKEKEEVVKEKEEKKKEKVVKKEEKKEEEEAKEKGEKKEDEGKRVADEDKKSEKEKDEKMAVDGADANDDSDEAVVKDVSPGPSDAEN